MNLPGIVGYVFREVTQQYSDAEADVLGRNAEPISELLKSTLLTYLEREGERRGDKLALSRWVCADRLVSSTATLKLMSLAGL